MRHKLSPFKMILTDETGSAIVITMLTLVIVTIIGLSTIENSITEKTIATNEILHQQAFYEADGGTEMAAELIEYNIGTVSGFTAAAGEDTVVFTDADNTPLVYVEKTSADDFAFWMNDEDDIEWETGPTDSDTDRDFYITTSSQQSRTNLRVGGSSGFSPGSAIQMAAGYEGRGKSAAVGGSHLLFKIYSQHIGMRHSKATVMVGWRHVIGNEEAKE